MSESNQQDDIAFPNHVWDRLNQQEQSIREIAVQSGETKTELKHLEKQFHTAFDDIKQHNVRLEEKVDTLSTNLSEKDGASDFRRWALPVLISIIAIAVTIWNIAFP